MSISECQKVVLSDDEKEQLREKIPDELFYNCLIKTFEEVPCKNEYDFERIYKSFTVKKIFDFYGRGSIGDNSEGVTHFYFLRMFLHHCMLMSKARPNDMNCFERFLDALCRFAPPFYDEEIRECAGHKCYLRQFIRLYHKCSWCNMPTIMNNIFPEQCT